MWCVEYPKSTGPGRNREYFKDPVEAEKCRKEKEIGIANCGTEGVLTSHERNLFHECNKALIPFGKTLRDATEFFVEHLKTTSKSCSASRLVDELIAAKKADGASQRHVDDLRRLNLFAEKFNGQPVATTTSAEIDDWLRSLNVSPVTRNHYRRLIVLAFNFAVRRGYAAENPAKETAKAKEDGGNIGILTAAQSAQLLESATPDVLPYFAIGLFAGLRRAELERLDWSEIDFESGLIEVTAKNAKTARRRHVTLQPNLRE
jgi:integrase